jgi:hypothetical protein
MDDMDSGYKNMQRQEGGIRICVTVAIPTNACGYVGVLDGTLETICTTDITI